MHDNDNNFKTIRRGKLLGVAIAVVVVVVVIGDGFTIQNKKTFVLAFQARVYT